MKRRVFSLFAFGLVVLGLAGIVPGFLSQVGVQAAEDNNERAITLDVACDCRTFAFNRAVSFDQVVRGDGFITNGKVFPANTLGSGTQNNDPNDPGSIGTWVCRGTSTGAASHPFIFFTQYHMLDNGSVLVSEGFDTATVGRSAVVGGMGALSGASGEISAVEIGTNSTGCPNIRFTINLKRQANKEE